MTVTGIPKFYHNTDEKEFATNVEAKLERCSQLDEIPF